MLTQAAGFRCCDANGCNEAATVRLRLRLPTWSSGEACDLCGDHARDLLEAATVVDDVDQAGWLVGRPRARADVPLVSHVEAPFQPPLAPRRRRPLARPTQAPEAP